MWDPEALLGLSLSGLDWETQVPTQAHSSLLPVLELLPCWPSTAQPDTQFPTLPCSWVLPLD